MEKKIRVNAKKKGEFISLSDEELVFTESTKEPCETCKEPKEIEVKMEKYTKQEMDLAMTMVNRFNLSRQEVEWLTNLNNRALNDKKLAGCGKCLVQVKKNLSNLYRRLYG